MIYYKPITDKKSLEELYPNTAFSDDALFGGYIGFDEDGTNVGKCLVKISEYKCFILSVNCDFSDKLLTEGFVRSALNFCANRSAYMAFCEQDSISDILLNLGFIKDSNNIYSGDIPTLLKGSCCK